MFRYFPYRKAILFITTILIAISLLGCKNTYLKSSKGDNIKYLIGVSHANLFEPWRIVMNKEIEEEASKYNDLKVIFTDAAQDSSKQIKDVEKLLELGIDLLIISPNDSVELTPIIAKTYESIPVIVLDRAVEGYDYTLHIGPDNRLIGRKAGQYILDLVGDRKTNIIEIQGLSGSPPVRERSEGFREVIEHHDNITILDTIVADWQKDKAEDKFIELASKHDKIDVVFAHNDPMAYGAYIASNKLQMKDIKFVGVDGLHGENGGLQLVSKNILQGTFTCNTGGREAIQNAIDILNNVKGIPKKIILRSEKITSDNVDEFINLNKIQTKHHPKKGNIVLGFAQVGAESEWRKTNSNSIKSAAQEAGIELKFMDAEQSQEKQIRAIRSFIKEGVDVIAFSPKVETGWEEVLMEAKAAGIPVILSDRTIKVNDDSLYTTFIGSDFVEEGRRAARWIVDHFGEKANSVNIVELQGTVGSGPAIDRRAGFLEVLKKNNNFKIIESRSGDFTVEGGRAVMRYILQTGRKDIDAVYAHNDDMALGAIEAIEEYGLKPGKDIIIVSIDAVRVAFNAMIAGKLNCTVECNPLLGPQLMKAVIDLNEGKKLPIKIITAESVFPADVAKKEISNRKY